MKLFHSRSATLDLARFFRVIARSPLLLLCSLTLTGPTLLIAAPARAQTLYRSLTFERNRGQAPKEVKWLGRSSGYRALFEGSGATFLHPDENNTRVMKEQRPVPVGNSRDRSSRDKESSHQGQATPKPRNPRRKLALVEGQEENSRPDRKLPATGVIPPAPAN
jgi:hypothetical protein